MVTYFFGVTLDFPIKRQQRISPDTLTSHKYVDCPQPSSDAYEKWWSDASLIMLKHSGLMHLLMQIFSKPFKLLFCASHFCQMLSGTISSQPCMTWHKPWRSLLPCKRNGHANPRGSHIEFITESMPPLLIGWSFKLILNFITSFLASLNIPNAFSIGRLPVQSLSFAASLLSASGIWNSISFLLLMNFVYLNPPFLHRSLTS